MGGVIETRDGDEREGDKVLDGGFLRHVRCVSTRAVVEEEKARRGRGGWRRWVDANGHRRGRWDRAGGGGKALGDEIEIERDDDDDDDADDDDAR